MPAAPPEPQPFLTNLRLVASPWHLFVFAIHPALATMGLILVAITLGYESIIPARPRLVLGVIYVVSSVLFALKTSGDVRDRLLKDGYVQSYTRRPMMEYAFNLAIMYAMYRWLQNWANTGDGAGKAWGPYAHPTLWVVWWVVVTILVSIGPILYFTARMTPTPVRDAVAVGR
jgi:hypothetical protein